MCVGAIGVSILSAYFLKFLQFRRDDERRKKRKIEDFNRAIEHILERSKAQQEINKEVEQKKIIRVNFKDKNRRDNEPPTEA
tara:strand:+ start:184 stop:429 length:246 start_codon:yes stop_codon:yes gene_type:complete